MKCVGMAAACVFAWCHVLPACSSLLAPCPLLRPAHSPPTACASACPLSLRSFVTFAEDASAEAVFAAGSMHDLGGKRVEVKPATPKGSGSLGRPSGSSSAPPRPGTSGSSGRGSMGLPPFGGAPGPVVGSPGALFGSPPSPYAAAGFGMFGYPHAGGC